MRGFMRNGRWIAGWVAVALAGGVLLGCADEEVGPATLADPEATDAAITAPALGFLPGQDLGPVPVAAETFGALTQTVTRTETGAVIEITAEDPEVVAQLQALGVGIGRRHPRGGPGRDGRINPLRDRIETTVTPIENGIRIEHVGQDEAAIAAIHRHVETLGTHRWPFRPRRLVERQVVPTETGFDVIWTAEEPEAIRWLHVRAEQIAERKPPWEDVAVTVEPTEDGFVVHVQGTTPEAVERLQVRPRAWNGPQGVVEPWRHPRFGGPHHGPEMMDFDE